MKHTFSRLVPRLFITGLLIGTLFAPTAALAVQTASSPRIASMATAQKAPVKWAAYNPQTRVAKLTVISAYGKDSYNFNGGSRGHFTFTVPFNSKVVVTYSNMSMHMPHGIEIVGYTGSLPTNTAPPPAFSGAASPGYRHGTMANVTQHFAFVANRAGKYLMICPVRSHVKFGHWAWFIVSKSASTATGVLR